jgi:hypothetical protein
MPSPTQLQEDAVNALFQAQRTLEPEALTLAERQAAAAVFRANCAAARQAMNWEHQRLQALGPAGRYDEMQAAAYSTYHL